MKTTDVKNPSRDEEVSLMPLKGDILKNRPRCGDICPQCKKEHLDYNGLLNLVCPTCGIILAGCFT